jgi:hypothetical protein
MLPAPLLHALDFALAAEVRSVAKLVSPTPLTGQLTGLPTRRSRTVFLVMPVPVIGTEEDLAKSTLAPAWFATHRGPSRKKRTAKSNKKKRTEEDPKRRRKKSFQREQPKKTQSEEYQISNRRFSGTIIPPLTDVDATGKFARRVDGKFE